MGKMEKQRIRFNIACAMAAAAYVLCAVLLYQIVGEQMKFRPVEIRNQEITTAVGELKHGGVIRQDFYCEIEEIQSVFLDFASYFRQNKGNVYIHIMDADTGEALGDRSLELNTLSSDLRVDVLFGVPIQNARERTIGIVLSSDSPEGQAVALYANDSAMEGHTLSVNGEVIEGSLAFAVTGKNLVPFRRYYLTASIALGCVLLCYLTYLSHCQKVGKKTLGLNLLRAFRKYRFLLSQLIARDFKTKYKRSVLGVVWSLLNPLLMMAVQFIVFSTVFKQDIQNFPAYLLIGVVFFNFFNEACGLGLGSIVENASLITKVYIPKYIFPVSRVLSSGVNFILSFIPLVLVVLFTGVPLKASVLLMPFPIICIILFSHGMAMFLSSVMVFFRDLRFLWNVLSMLWMYATPIFYPESIIPDRFLPFIKMNPVYHFIRFSRTVIIDGLSPQPMAYLYCLIGSIIPLFIGAYVFKKTQNKFVNNL